MTDYIDKTVLLDDLISSLDEHGYQYFAEKIYATEQHRLGRAFSAETRLQAELAFPPVTKRGDISVVTGLYFIFHNLMDGTDIVKYHRPLIKLYKSLPEHQ